MAQNARYGARKCLWGWAEGPKSATHLKKNIFSNVSWKQKLNLKIYPKNAQLKFVHKKIFYSELKIIITQKRQKIAESELL